MILFKLITMFSKDEMPVKSFDSIKREDETGIFESFDQAFQCLVGNYGDMYEHGYYNYAIIKQIRTGQYGFSQNSALFKVTPEINQSTGKMFYKISTCEHSIYEGCSHKQIELSSDQKAWIVISNELARIWAENPDRDYCPLFEQFQTIHKNYSETNRFYHTLTHIGDCIKKLSHFELTDKERNTLIMAFIYHDIIYKLENSEEDSAKLFSNSYWGSDVEYSEVADLILMTKTHKPMTKIQEIMSDIDMSILGSDEEVYKKYCDDIEREYLSMGVPKETFDHNRKLFLLKLKDFKYSTKIGQSLWQDQLIKNLK